VTPAEIPEPARVEALFDALADLDVDEARRCLAAECGSDRALFDAVWRLLEHDRARTPSFLARPPTLLGEAMRERADRTATTALDAGAETLDTLDSVDERLSVGSARLGAFYVLHKLGEGGMGAVYLGYDETLGRRVALKVLHRGAAAKAWLVREGQALARLAHPNVVAIHAVGEHEGRAFLAMELVEGPTLRAWLAAEARPFAEVMRLFVEAARGLAAAHEAGLVHRDFKPDNVLVGKDGRARVGDFGIVSLRDAAARDEALGSGEPRPDAPVSPLTLHGALVGTPGFIAPEQMRGERATHASDQFSFCVSLYRALYRVSPFDAVPRAGVADGGAALAPNPPPSGSGVPPWIAPILMRGLASEPVARYPSMSALIGAIERHIPRDPELDPTRVHRERELLSGIFMATCVAATAPLLSEAATEVLVRPAFFVGLPAAIAALVATMVVLRWRRLCANRYGRRVALTFIVGAALFALHRAAGVVTGAPVDPILLGDMFVMGAVFAIVGILDQAFAGVMAAITIGAAIVAMALPVSMPRIYGTSGLLLLVAMGVRLYLDRHMRPGPAPIQPNDRSDRGV
jgi:serine/threonine-protein kinase